MEDSRLNFIENGSILSTINGLKSEENNELETNTVMTSPPIEYPFSTELLPLTTTSIILATHTQPIAVVEPIPDAPPLRRYYNSQIIDWSKKDIVALGSDGTITLWDPFKDNAWNCLEHSYNITALAWHDFGRILAVGTECGEVFTLNTNNFQMEERLKGHYKRISALAWQGDMLYVGSKDGRLLKWNVEYAWDDPIYLQGHTEDICSLQCSPNRKYMASSAYDQNVLIWTNDSKEPMHTLIGHKGPVHGLAWSTLDNDILASGGGQNDKSIHFWNVLTGECVLVVYTGIKFTNLAWSPKGDKIVTAHIGENKRTVPDIVVWSYPSMMPEWQLLPKMEGIFDVATSPDGDYIVIGYEDGKQRLWSAISMPEKP